MNNMLISKLQKQLSGIDGLRELDASSQEFKRWQYTTQFIFEQTGSNNARRFRSIRFTPNCTIDGVELGSAEKCYSDGLDKAEALISAFTDAFNGMDNLDEDKMDYNQSTKLPININLSQTQSQSISNAIHLSEYDKDTREKLRELAQEVRKSNNSGKIAPIVKWLADKSVDALIALLPTMIKFE